MTDREKRIETLENALFDLKMKDRWTPQDYERDARWTKELNELKKR